MRKIIAIVMVCTLFLSLSACGKTAVEQTGSIEQMTWQEQYDLGVRYLSEGDYEEAIIAFTAAIEIDPKQAPAYVGRGDAYVLSGETDENLAAAQADYETAIGLDETNAEAYLGLADVYIRQGEYDKALEILQTGLEKTGQDQAIAEKLSEIESGNYTDSSGHTRRMNSYDGEGNLVWYHAYDYDNDGRESAVTSYDAAGNQTGRVDVSYNENGNMLVYYWSETKTGRVGRAEYEYDAAGKQTKAIWYSVDGVVIGYSTFEYDEKGNQVRENEYSENWMLEGYRETAFNADGQPVREDYYYNGELEYYQTKTYSTKGMITEYCEYDAAGRLSWKEVFIYDEQGRRIREDKYNGKGELEGSITYE